MGALVRAPCSLISFVHVCEHHMRETYHALYSGRDSLATPEVQAEAHNMREAALREVTDLSKLNVLTLRAVLAHRGLDSSGLKAALVKRVVDYVLQS